MCLCLKFSVPEKFQVPSCFNWNVYLSYVLPLTSQEDRASVEKLFLHYGTSDVLHLFCSNNGPRLFYNC